MRDEATDELDPLEHVEWLRWSGTVVGYLGYVGYQVLAGTGADQAGGVRLGLLAWLVATGVLSVVAGLVLRRRERR